MSIFQCFISKSDLYITIYFSENFIGKLNELILLTIIVATEKDGDWLQRKLRNYSVAIISIIIITLTIFNVSSEEKSEKKVILGGVPFGLKLFTSGVLVVEVEKDSPADKADIKVNDIIIRANEIEIDSNEKLKEIIESTKDNEIVLTINRNGKTVSETIVPEKKNNNYSAGMWIRDSCAGIGTITYYDPENMSFGALGHGICDPDTGMLMPLRNGDIMSATISHVTKAQDGVVGGLNGYFDDKKIGSITVNNGFGIYGNYEFVENGSFVTVANDNEIKKGEAYILSTIDEGKPKLYKVKLSKINLSKTNGQNMTVTVVDEELLKKTGGIIAGMSGSPILQNGKLVGAVTHVFVNSPEKGYGISINNMLSNYEQFG